VVALPLVLPPTVLGFYVLVAIGPKSPVGQWYQAIVGHPLVFTFEGLLFASVLYSLPFAVQPFTNYLTTITLTGAQIDLVLEQQVFNSRMLQPSAGFTYSWHTAAPGGAKVDSIAINGVPIDPTALYRVTVNNFLADGGDGFTVFTQGTNRLTGVIDIEALVAYFGTASPVPPGPQNRITVLP